MKTPRHEQPWYACRLENNSKPGAMTQEERTAASTQYISLLAEAPRLVAYGIKMGWLKYPLREQHRKWNPENIPTPTDSSLW
jgi:hypothetical protein